MGESTLGHLFLRTLLITNTPLSHKEFTTDGEMARRTVRFNSDVTNLQDNLVHFITTVWN